MLTERTSGSIVVWEGWRVRVRILHVGSGCSRLAPRAAQLLCGVRHARQTDLVAWRGSGSGRP